MQCNVALINREINPCLNQFQLDVDHTFNTAFCKDTHTLALTKLVMYSVISLIITSLYRVLQVKSELF